MDSHSAVGGRLRACLWVSDRCAVVAHRPDGEPGLYDGPRPAAAPRQDRRLQRPHDAASVGQSV